MKRASTYPSHQESLEKFKKLFNSTIPLELQMFIPKKENFIADGHFELNKKQKTFDWGKRYTWEGGLFPYKTLRQFDRKFEPSKNIYSTLQGSLKDDYFVFALHSDFKPKEDLVMNETDNIKSKEKVWETLKFKCYPWTIDGMREFKKDLETNF